ncbi:MAG TPA: alpha/beta fold hydrolase [Chryseosolibacter sp.]|nr:alpha/beta fold hydrolase [Chryseosolibacter sp.]
MSTGKHKGGENKAAKELLKEYLPPFFLFNPHLETIFPALLRRVVIAPYTRERIYTADDDFLDLDWLQRGGEKVVIISHGLEGSSDRPYVKGMAKALHENGFDVVAWNFRGCSGEMNRQRRFYHSGATEDLHTVVEHVMSLKKYQSLYLIGFSLGGNLTLKYLGERDVSPFIQKAVAISVPLDLQTSCDKISQPSNRIYSNRFVRSLKKKIATKAQMRTDLDASKLPHIKTLTEFDDCYTAPLHGFPNAREYYSQCSAIRFVEHIKTPTLIINTRNDPFLSDECFPAALLEGHPFVSLEVLSRGGHVGFTQFNKNGLYWSEQRALEFLFEFATQ